jgi:hypothetical protein
VGIGQEEHGGGEVHRVESLPCQLASRFCERLVDGIAVGDALVEGTAEVHRRAVEHAELHGDDGGDASVQQARGQVGEAFIARRHGCLAGGEEHQAQGAGLALDALGEGPVLHVLLVAVERLHQQEAGVFGADEHAVADEVEDVGVELAQQGLQG